MAIAEAAAVSVDTVALVAAAVAAGTAENPGSSQTGRMASVVAVAVVRLRPVAVAKAASTWESTDPHRHRTGANTAAVLVPRTVLVEVLTPRAPVELLVPRAPAAVVVGPRPRQRQQPRCSAPRRVRN